MVKHSKPKVTLFFSLRNSDCGLCSVKHIAAVAAAEEDEQEKKKL
jgi:hypothetical protein